MTLTVFPEVLNIFFWERGHCFSDYFNKPEQLEEQILLLENVDITYIFYIKKNYY